eukprot:gene18055-23309_t
MKADDNGLAQRACPLSSAFIYFQAAYILTISRSLHGSYFPDSMQEPRHRLFYAGGV